MEDLLCIIQISYGKKNIRPVYLQSFADKNINFLDNLLDGSGNFKSWNELRVEFNLVDNWYFSWMQLINSIALNWRNIIKKNCSSTNLLLLNHHLTKKNNLISLDKLNCLELYNMLVYISPHKPTSQLYFENLFRKQDLNWKEIHLLLRKASLDCYVRSFQYKVLNKVLYLNKKHHFWKFIFSSMFVLQIYWWNRIPSFLWMRYYQGIVEKFDFIFW